MWSGVRQARLVESLCLKGPYTSPCRTKSRPLVICACFFMSVCLRLILLAGVSVCHG